MPTCTASGRAADTTRVGKHFHFILTAADGEGDGKQEGKPRLSHLDPAGSHHTG